MANKFEIGIMRRVRTGDRAPPLDLMAKWGLRQDNIGERRFSFTPDVALRVHIVFSERAYVKKWKPSIWK